VIEVSVGMRKGASSMCTTGSKHQSKSCGHKSNMKKHTYNLLREPCDNDYRDLLDFAIRECKYFLLVTDKDNKQLCPTGKLLLERLSQFLYKLEMKSEWPGTILLHDQVPVYTYFLVPENLAILKKSATRLYQWQRPNLPDDLCFLRSDETPWLVNIAHENDGYFEISEQEKKHLVSVLPHYRTMISYYDMTEKHNFKEDE
jgi:hypothetical protein